MDHTIERDRFHTSERLSSLGAPLVKAQGESAGYFPVISWALGEEGAA